MNDNVAPAGVARVWQRVKASVRQLVREPAFYVYLISVVIYLPWFLPTLSEIAPWDETYFIASGKGLVNGDWPVLGYGPFLSLVAPQLFTLSGITLLVDPRQFS